MVKQYDIENNIKSIQSILISESIKERSNLQLLKSEEAIRNVLQSYSDKMNATGDKLTKLSQHIVNSKDIITKDKFNDLFNSLYIDIKTLYQHIDYVDEVLSLNLHRNRKFFNVLKKRMRELWNKLVLTRLNITDSSQFDESYFEAFSTINSKHKYTGVLIDKKSGVMTLQPRESFIHNKKYLIKDVQTTTYPVHNNDGGVIHTSSYLNSFASSYRRDGQRDMLENGLWKEQILCNEIPDIKYDIKEDPNELDRLFKSVNGILSLVDIEFTQPVQFNDIEIDLFGDYPTTLVSILHKSESDGVWLPVKKLDSIQVGNDYQTVDNSKEETAFDVLSIKNIERTNARFMRLVFNQVNYDILDNSEFSIKSLDDKIYNDLSERRYEVVKLDGGADDRPAIPKSYDNDSLYSQVTDVIEDTRSLEETITKIIDILEPTPKLQSINFKKTLKYEIGAWSIEPRFQSYSGEGKFNSGDYPIRDRSLISVSLLTKQEDIKYNTCNWYISNKGYNKYIPIIENKRGVRKEPAKLINPDYFEHYPTGAFIHLDLPSSNIDFENNTKIWINGGRENGGLPHSIGEFNWLRLNSTLVHIVEIDDIYKNDYVIQYVPAILDSLYVFTLERLGEEEDGDLLPYEVVASRKSMLRYFLSSIGKTNEYLIKTSRATALEASMWFNVSSQTICVTKAIETLYSLEIPVAMRTTMNVIPGTRAVKDLCISRDLDYNLALPPMMPFIIERDIK